MRYFPGSLVVMTSHFQCRGERSVPGQGTKISHVPWRGQQNKTKQNKTKQKQNFMIAVIQPVTYI